MSKFKFSNIFSVILCVTIGLSTACSDSGSKKATPTDTEESELAVRLSSSLTESLVDEGVSRDKAETISEAGEAEANAVYLTSLPASKASTAEEVLVVPQNFISGAMGAIDDAGISDLLLVRVAGVIMESPIQDLSDDLSLLEPEELTTLMGEMSGAAVGSLDEGGFGTRSPLAVRTIMSRGIGALDDAIEAFSFGNATDDTIDGLNDLLQAMNAGAVGAIDEGGFTKEQIDVALMNITSGAVGALDEIDIGGFDMPDIMESIRYITTGATAALDDAGLEADDINDALMQLNAGATGALDEAGLQGEFITTAMGNITAGSISALDDLVIADFAAEQMAGALAYISAGVTSSIDDTGIPPSLMDEALLALNTGSVAALDNLAAFTGFDAYMDDAVANISTGSIGALDDITGLSQDQLIACSQWVIEGAALGIDDIVDATGDMTAYIDLLTTSSVGALDLAGIPAEYIDEAALAMTNSIYGTLDDIGYSASDAAAMLDDIQGYVVAGFDNIDSSLIDGTFVINDVTGDIYDYTGTYVDPYADQFICEATDDAGCGMLMCPEIAVEADCMNTIGCLWETDICIDEYMASGTTAPGEICYTRMTAADCAAIDFCMWDVAGMCMEGIGSFCSTIPDSVECDSIPECAWDGTVCTVGQNASTGDCASLGTEEACLTATVMGCSWDSVTMLCGGTGAIVACEDIPDQTECTTNPAAIMIGCEWDGAMCIVGSGENTCDSFVAEEECMIAQGIGCFWDMAANVCVDGTGSTAGPGGDTCAQFVNPPECNDAVDMGCTWIDTYAICMEDSPGDGTMMCSDVTTAAACIGTMNSFGMPCVWTDSGCADGDTGQNYGSCPEIMDAAECSDAPVAFGLNCIWDNLAGGCIENTGGTAPVIPTMCTEIAEEAVCMSAGAYGLSCEWAAEVCIEFTGTEPTSCGEILNQADCDIIYSALGCMWSMTSETCVQNQGSPVACGDIVDPGGCNSAIFSPDSPLACIWMLDSCETVTQCAQLPLDEAICNTASDYSLDCIWNMDMMMCEDNSGPAPAPKSCGEIADNASCLGSMGLYGFPCEWTGDLATGFCGEVATAPTTCAELSADETTCLTAPTYSLSCMWTGSTCDPLDCGSFSGNQTGCGTYPTLCYWNSSNSNCYNGTQPTSCTEIIDDYECENTSAYGFNCTWSTTYCEELID